MTSLITVRQIKNHTEAVRQSILMIDNIEIMLEYNNLSIEEIFKSLNLSSNFSLLTFVNEIYRQIGIGEEFETAYSDVLSDLSLTRAYDNEDRAFMSGFLSLLGKSDVSGQIANCKMYKEFFKTKLSALESDETNRCKASASAILGIGAMVSIILI